MIRKNTAIFFILLANIVLLVHLVVPHHHHKSLVCIESNHCQSDSHAHIQSNCANEHEHDGSSGTENCALKQTVVISANLQRQEIKHFGCDENHSPSVHFQAILFSNEFASLVPEIIQKAQIPTKSSTLYRLFSASSGLRAPPIV